MLVVPVGTLLQRLPPRDYVDGQSLVLAVGDRLDLDATRRRLERAGYSCVSQVMGHGEFAVRGSILDFFPMGSQEPLRIDLLDDEVETIRTFDPETQRTREKVDRVRMLPAREFPLSEEAISGFRQRYRAQFEGDPKRSLIYREVSEGRTPGGLEYYLPLFFEQTATLFDYLPERRPGPGVRRLPRGRQRLPGRGDSALRAAPPRHGAPPAAARPALSGRRRTGPGSRPCPASSTSAPSWTSGARATPQACNFATRPLPPLGHPGARRQPGAGAPGLPRRARPARALRRRGPGRREMLDDHLHGFGIARAPCEAGPPSWPARTRSA